MFSSLTKARRPIVVTFAVGVLLAVTALPTGARSAPAPASAAAARVSATPVVTPDGTSLASPYTAGKYVVVLSKAPIASYRGGTGNIPATTPQAGRKMSLTSLAARQYAGVLHADQNRIARS